MDILVQFAQNAFYFSYALVPNWGFAILLFTFAIRLILFPLQIFTMREQAKIARLKPTLDALQERHRTEPRRLLEERSLVLKNAGIRPSVSMVAMMIQLPIFFAVYEAISTNSALGSFGFAWLPNLAQHDPLFILPFILALTVWFQSRSSNASPQVPKSFAYGLSALSFFFMATMPAGVALYSVASSVLQFASQKMIS
ncbi:MAG: membrane protein insertase YidC [Deltaproteobacteria bacterium]|jgi:YidC/Oxa1 family membrane protein insertase|nr:membrane protein insertase YidC [Deltaproteobacteria bacterium]